MNEFESFLQELAKVLQFSSLKSDQNGACLILLKEKQVSLLFEWDDELVPNTVLLSSQLLPFPIEYRQDMYEACLKANKNIEETFSVKPDEDHIYLHKRLHPKIHELELKLHLDGFTENFNLWKEKFHTLLKTPPKIAKSPQPSSMRIFPFKA